MVKLIKMRFDNDCTVASVAMATRLPYSKCLRIAKQHGFTPYHRTGFDIGLLLVRVNVDFDCAIFRLRMLQQPVIVSIRSLNNRNGFHAVVVDQGKVYDPSNKKCASFNYVLRNYRHTYYGF